MFATLGLQSDILALQGLSVCEDRGDYVILRTPKEPNFWDGNRVIFRNWSGDRAADLAVFAHAFPDATHVSLQWDRPDIPPQQVLALFGPGYEVSVEDVLTQHRDMPTKDMPDGITIREILCDDDWAKVQVLQLETAAEDGTMGDVHAAFLARRNVNRRTQIAHDLGAWFGAFDGDVLIADMGIFHDARVARYQAVETAKTHRRRGICGALLRHVRLWVAARAPDARPVIVAETDGDAGRLYRGMGFSLVERLPAVTRPGY